MAHSCPLCDSVATFDIVQNPDGRIYKCPSCNEFFIDGPSEKRLIEGEPEARSKAQRGARASSPSRLFVIRQPRRNEVHGDGVTSAREVLTSEYIDR